MSLCKLHFLTALLIFNWHIMFSQQQYQAGDYGGPGTIYLYNRLTSILPIQEITNAGANVNWDLSLNTELNTHPTRIISKSQAIDQFTFLTICGLSGNSPFECFNIWNNTEQSLLLQDSLSLFGYSLADLQRYQNKKSNLLLENFFGFTIDFGGLPTQGVIVYNSPDTILHFPVIYNDSWTSNIEWSIDLSPVGQNIRYTSIQNRTSLVDSWGTVITPYDTFSNVVRVRSEIVHTDTLFTDTLDVPVGITQVEYMWFDTNYKLPVMIATGVIMDTLEIINVVEYIYEATCASPTWDVQTAGTIYYIDNTGSVDVNFEITNSNANVYTWDFGDGTFETSGGGVSHTYYVAGNYSVGVTGCMTNCLPLNSCSFDILDFEIIDTVTFVKVVQGKELGLRLYPHPVREFFKIEIPDEVGPQDFSIVDIAGHLVARGRMNTGESIIRANGLQDGIYFIHLRGYQGYHYTITVMRFLVLRQ